MQLIKQSEATAARRRIPIALVDDTDGKTPETGITLVAGDMKIAKAGGAEANHAGTLTELAGGDYYYEPTAGEVDTLGYLTGRLVKAGVRTFRFAAEIVAFDPHRKIPSEQEIARQLYGTKGTVWHVAEGGSDANDGLSWDTALATLTQAVSGAAAYDVIVLRGSITNNTATGQLPDGVSVVGAIGHSAKITSNLATNGAMLIKPGNRTLLRGFTIQCTDASFNFISPIGLSAFAEDAAKIDVLIEDMHVIGTTDAILCDVSNCINWTIRRCRLESQFDIVALHGAGSTWLVEDNDIIGTGPFPPAGSTPIKGIYCSAGTVLARRNRIKSSGGESSNLGIHAGGGVVHVYDNVFDTSGTNAIDIWRESGTCIDYGNNRGSGAGGALTTSGTITNRKGHTGIDMGTVKQARTIKVDTGTFAPTTTVFETDQTVDEAAYYNDQVLYALDGANAGMTVRITGYEFTNSKVKLTVDALKVAPSSLHGFTLFGRIEQ